MKLLMKWVVYAFSIFIAAYLLPGVELSGFKTALVVALALGIINALIRPIVLLLTLPVNILSLGLFTFIVNAFMVIIASSIVSGFRVNGFFWALLFSLVLSLVNLLFQKIFLGEENDNYPRGVSKIK